MPTAEYGFHKSGDSTIVLPANWDDLVDGIEEVFLGIAEILGSGILHKTDGIPAAVAGQLAFDLSRVRAIIGSENERVFVHLGPQVAVDDSSPLLTGSIAASTTNYVFIKKDGTLEVNQTGTPPADSELLFSGVTDADEFTSFDTTRTNIAPLLPSYGEMFENIPAGVTVTVTTAGTYYGWISAGAGVLAPDSPVAFTGDATADRLTVGAEGEGIYQVTARVNAKGPNSANVTFAIHKNGTIQNNLKAYVEFDATAKVAQFLISGFISLEDTDYIDLRVTSSTNADVITIYQASVLLQRIG